MKKSLILTIVFSLAMLAVFAQKGLVTGQVVDNQNLSLPGAVLRLEPGRYHTLSDDYGKFEFLNVPEGTYSLVVTYMGYQAFHTEVMLSPGKTVTLAVRMQEAPIVGTEVFIMGDRLKGQAKALNNQKSNENITNVVSSDQGEARDIIIRGLAPELNSVTLNGNRIPSAEGDNRRVQMDLIPSDMIQTIEVSKTLTPDMDADAIGGSVNLITRAALASRRISATFSGGYNPIRETPLFTGGLVYGNRFLNNKLGLVLSGSYNSNTYGSDNVESVWKEDDFGNVYVEELEIRKYDVKRVRRSIAAALDYKFNERNTITFNAMYNWRDDWENRYSNAVKDLEPEYDDQDQITGFTGSMIRENKAGANSGRGNGSRLEEQRVQQYSLRGDHLIGSQLDMDWSVSYSTASEYKPNERYISFEAEDVAFGKGYDTEAFPLVQPLEAPLAAAYGLDELSQSTSSTSEDELGVRLNFRIPMSVIPDQKGRLRFGGRLRFKHKVRDNNFNEYTPIGDDMADLSLVPTVNWPGDKYFPNAKYVPGFFADKNYVGGLNLTNTSLFEGEDIPDEYLADNYTARETITAGYLRWDQHFSDKLSMILGLRLENTNINYEGNLIQDESELEGTRTIKNSYLNVLPGVTFKYNATQDFILRGAVTTSLARPNYYHLSPFVNTVLEDQEVMAGNPNLKAAYAWNVDLMAEYYFKSVGILSGGVFYKHISNFIYQYRNENLTNDEFASLFPESGNPVPSGEVWTLMQARNGDLVSMYGFELSLQRQLDFLPGSFLKGFGVYANYTFTQSSAKGIYNEDGELREDIALPGTAPHMLNLSLSWENKKFSARGSLNYAAGYISELGGDSFEDRFYDKQMFLDINASYTMVSWLRVFAEANNLTNQPLRFYQGVASRTAQMEYYGPRFNLGLKFDLNK